MLKKLLLCCAVCVPALAQQIDLGNQVKGQLVPSFIQPGVAGQCLLTVGSTTTWGTCATGSSGYTTIQSAGVALAQRSAVNFFGALSCVDNAGAARTDCQLVTPITVPQGGTGLATLTAHQLYVGNGTATPNPVAPGTAGQVLESNGASVDPSFQDPIVSGPDAPGVAPTRNPVQIGAIGADGNVHRVLSDNNGNLNALVTNFPATQAVSAAALPLPAGASTSTNQTNGTQQTQIVQGGNTAIVSAAGAQKVDGSAVTQPVSAASLPLPAGAATSSNQTNGTQQTQVTDGAGHTQPTGDASARTIHTTVDNASVTVVQGTGTNLHTVVDNFPATQPVSIATNVGVTQQTTPWLIANGTPTAQTASWTSATGLNTALTLGVLNYATAELSVDIGVITGGALTFEVQDSNSSGQWHTIQGVQVGSTVGSPGMGTTGVSYTLASTAHPVFIFNTSGVSSIRVRLSSVITGGGTVTVALQGVASPSALIHLAAEGATGQSTTGMPILLMGAQSSGGTLTPLTLDSSNNLNMALPEGVDSVVGTTGVANWSNATSANTALSANTTAIPLAGATTVAFNIVQSGAFTGGVITFEVLGVSGITASYVPVQGINISTGAAQGSTFSLTANSGTNVIIFSSVGAINDIRARLSTAISGAGTVALQGTVQGMGQPPGHVNLAFLGGVPLSGANVVDVGNSAFKVNCVTGCSSTPGFTDNTAFTAGTTTEANIGGVFNDGLSAVTSGNAAAARITTNRAVHMNLRNNAGTEIGTASNPVQVSLANTAANATAVKVDGSAVTQPVSATQGTAAATTAGWPVVGGTLTEQTAAWTSATGSNTTLRETITGYNSIAVFFNQTTTITGGVATFEASDTTAFTNAYPVQCVESNAGIVATTYTFVASTNQLWDCDVTGYTAFQVRLSTVISGTGTVNVGVTANSMPSASNVTANQGTSPWISNITQFGSTNVSTGTGASGAGIPRVTISNDSSLAANQSVNVSQFGGTNAATGTGASGAGIPRVTVSNDSSLTGTLANNGAAAATNRLGTLPAIAQTSYNNGTASTQGRDVAANAGTDGLLWVANLPAIRPASFVASKKFAASSTTDNAVMPGNATNTVLLTAIKITCTQTTAGVISVEILKRSTADTAGTSAAMTAVPDDSNYSAAVSAPLSYTGTGPTVGTPVGDVDNGQVGCLAPGTAGANDIYILNRRQKPIVLRGTAQQVAVNVGNAALTGGNLTVTFEWMEITTITP